MKGYQWHSVDLPTATMLWLNAGLRLDLTLLSTRSKCAESVCQGQRGVGKSSHGFGAKVRTEFGTCALAPASSMEMSSPDAPAPRTTTD